MEKNPVTRFRKWLEREGWWSGESEEELRSSLRKQVDIFMDLKIVLAKNGFLFSSFKSSVIISLSVRLCKLEIAVTFVTHLDGSHALKFCYLLTSFSAMR